MIQKAKQAVGDIKENIHKKKIQRTYSKKQKQLEEQLKEDERIKQEQQKLKAEYDRLSALDEKQMMVELIFAVRGFYSEMESLKIEYQELTSRINGLESDIESLRYEIQAANSEN